MTIEAQLGTAEEKYEILEKLGEGGMGAIYKVRHRLLDEIRVIKVILHQHQGDPSAQIRFQREARAATRLRHPNIAEVHDLTVDDSGTAHIVMEYLEGVTLQQFLAQNGPPELELAAEIAHQSLAALDYLHRQDYLHRDVSPDNFMLTRKFDGSVLVKLIDLGLAKSRVDSSLQATATGVYLGKVRYSAPEQFRQGETELDARCDLYSFGVVLYELLTGVCPIKGSTFAQLVTAHLLDEIPSFDATDPHGRIPADLRRTVLLSLEKDRELRIPTAAEFANALKPYCPKNASQFGDLELEILEKTRLVPASAKGSSKASSRSAQTNTWPGALPSEETLSALSLEFSQGLEGNQGLAGSPRLESGPSLKTGPSSKSGQELDSSGTLVEHHVSQRGNPRWQLPAAGAIIVILLGLLAIQSQKPEPVLTQDGNLLIEAVPWAEVRSIADEAGVLQPLDEPTYTPAMVPLAPGTYTITLHHPDDPEFRTVTAEVIADETVKSSTQFIALGSDRYFAAVGLEAHLNKAGLQ